MHDRSQHLSGIALVMVAAVLWATVGIASQLVPPELLIPDEVFGFARTAIAGPALLLAGLAAGGWAALGRLKGDMGGILVFGLGCALFQVGLFRSFSLIGVTITVFLTVCLPPVMAMAWSVLRHGEGVSRSLWTAMITAVLGLLAFSSTTTTEGEIGEILLGLGFSVAASAAFVVMSHAARGLGARHSPLLIAGGGLTVTSGLLAPLALLLWQPQTLAGSFAIIADWRSGGVLLYLGLVPTALAYLCFCTGMARCRSAVAGLVASMIEPAAAAGLALLLLHEFLSLPEMVGCALLVAAMLALWLEDAGKHVPSPAKA
jgi:drug/metabolite transporter, DME family